MVATLTLREARPVAPIHQRSRRRCAAVALALASLSLALPAVAASAASAAAPTCPFAATPIAHSPRARIQATVLCLVNQQRRSRGLPTLRASAELDRSAQGWSDAMVTRRDFSHGAFTARISAAGFDWSQAAENIATGYGTPDAVVAAWMASPGHCENILSPLYRDLGTGVTDGDIAGVSTIRGTWTQDFGLLMGQTPPSTDWGPAQGCPYRGPSSPADRAGLPVNPGGVTGLVGGVLGTIRG